ncbi:proton-conducting transporter membrane subunit, partial [Streptomyces sp. NPDC001393]
MSPTASAMLLTAPAAVPLVVAGGYALAALRTRTAAATLAVTFTEARQRVSAQGSVLVAEAPEPGKVPRWDARDWAGLVSPAVILTCGSLLARDVVGGGPRRAYSGLLRADALTAWMLLVVGAVALIACGSAPAFLRGERVAGRANDRTVWRYHALVQAFLAAMSLAVVTANLGVLWVAVEATTIVTAFLVGHRHTRASVEAAWKYVVICSAG